MMSLFSRSALRLPQLVEGLSLSKKCTSTVIKGISLDSRALMPGGLFIALKGSELEGTKFVPEAIKRGAVAVLLETDRQNLGGTIEIIKAAIPIIGVENLYQNV